MASAYKPTIGLEIHAELKTSTKMFCNSKNDPDETRPNVNVCPVCLAHPGTLPVINREAVAHVLRVGAALGAKLADYTEFDRKNYFYPDLPKGYQISQYEFPLVSGGTLSGVQITRVHLEEDTASSIHDETTGATLVDFNRAGVPLMELVTEPVVESAPQAGAFARELQLLLRYLGASDANMEKGEMRVEANISISKDGVLGTKVEIKNLNSFRAMERAVEYEIKRQEEVLERGEKVLQETRGWDEGKQSTFAQRIKEGSADYRYFPDPDLPSLRLSEIEGYTLNDIHALLPELPSQRRQRYLDLGIKSDDADSYVREVGLGAFFDQVIAAYPAGSPNVLLASNYIANDLVRIIRDIDKRDTDVRPEMHISAEFLKTIIDLLAEKKLSSRGAKDLLEVCVREGKEPAAAAAERNLLSGDVDLGPVIDEILSTNPNVVEEYKAGKTGVLEYLVGQGMKALRGSGDPNTLREAIRARIGQ